MSKQTYTLLPCAIADSPELAGNNIPAFREDITWSLFMAHVPVEEHVKRTAKRIPYVFSLLRHSFLFSGLAGHEC